MGQALELADSRRPDTALAPVAAAPALEKAATPAPASPTVVVEAPASSVPQAVARPAAVEPTAPLPQPPVASEARFAQSNHAGIVTSIRGQLLPNGGTMQIRLDPPELGVLQVMVRVNDGMISASFQTSNDQATRLLSHSLAQLKSALQTTGVGVERLSVQQSKPDEQAAQQDPRQGAWDDQHNARQEQHRREALRRMWRRLGVEDPLDMVA
jgi:flagellar hook-length control protein FliK